MLIDRDRVTSSPIDGRRTGNWSVGTASPIGVYGEKSLVSVSPVYLHIEIRERRSLAIPGRSGREKGHVLPFRIFILRD